jgi:hypothetical protein
MITKLTKDQILAIIKSMMDESWWGPLEEAGNEDGHELLEAIAESAAASSAEVEKFDREMHASYAGNADSATVTLTFSRTEDFAFSVPAGTRVWTPWGIAFKTNEAASWIEGNSDDVDVTALACASSDAYNVPAGTLRELRNPTASGLGDASLTVTNALAATGGQLQVLDFIASDERVFREPGEGNEDLRERIRKQDDSITPAAIKRAVRRILAPFGKENDFEYVDGFSAGMFADKNAYCDAGQSESSSVYRQAKKLLLSVNDSRRAFFIVVPTIGALGEYGLFCDGHSNVASQKIFALDESAASGRSTVRAAAYSAIWRTINQKKPAGVRAIMVGKWSL